ncbi:MAG TPA: methyltransferase domain-containing protein [Rhabdochlamydiaceae bacterium]|nr:methyltransferase domain-containing protein [Rhabdochlamydiaceae bacterium]
MNTNVDSSWEKVTSWYDKIVGADGHYFHQQIILPNVLKLLDVNQKLSILDLACGQGILARYLPKDAIYVGIDASASLIKAASRYNKQKNHRFAVGDITCPLRLDLKKFTHGTLILALQNIGNPLAVLKNIHSHLIENGQLIIVINHPCFRIPRQSSWQIDDAKKMQFRRIDRYLSPLEIPIQMHPSKQDLSPNTLSFHHPLSAYTSWLKESGFIIEEIQEWCSDKISSGKYAKMENRSRQEFPLFLAFIAKKI